VTLSCTRSSPTGEWGRRLSACMSRVLTFWARRETIKVLRELDDHQLRDIGLPRHQIESVIKHHRDSGASSFG